ncbi:MAG: alpha/beta fold hydrolase [Aquabacterium sp.]|jgi:pimeloyl-ACP methyl ester carboxylesterase|nr:MAG: alpha/beta fold hydrolase [Aquabacterium sp.]
MKRSSLIRGAAALVAAACLAYAAAVAAIWARQDALLFMPEKLSPDHDFRQADDVHEAWVEVPGARLHALHLVRPGARGVVFYLHGNGGSLSSWFTDLDFYRRAGFDLFMIDFRGYGKSTGRIASEAELHDDVRRAWAQVAPQYAGRKRVIYGRSMGTGMAAELAAGLRPGEADLLVLASAYVSIVHMAHDHFPWVPAFVLRYPLRTDRALPRVRMPVLLVHGELDRVIPYANSVALKALRPDADLLLLPDAGHQDLHLRAVYQDWLLARLAAL